MITSDTPETDEQFKSFPAYFEIDLFCRKLERERNEAREHWGTESMNAAQFFGEKTKAIAERDEAIKLLKYSSTYSTTKAQEDTYKFLRKINKWKDTK